MNLRERIVAQLANMDGPVLVTATEAMKFINEEGWHCAECKGYDPRIGGTPNWLCALVSKDGSQELNIPGGTTFEECYLMAALTILDL